jgi:ABC-type uncharacterized transport system fused permease/ATPase subunit
MDEDFQEWLKSRSPHAPTITKAQSHRFEIAFLAGMEAEKKKNEKRLNMIINAAQGEMK